MTIEITDEMVEQIRVDVYGKDDCNDCQCEGSEWERVEIRSYLTAALPIIERQMREQCAAEIEAVMKKEALGKVHNDPVIYMRNIGFQRGLKHAARIVREEE